MIEDDIKLTLIWQFQAHYDIPYAEKLAVFNFSVSLAFLKGVQPRKSMDGGTCVTTH